MISVEAQYRSMVRGLCELLWLWRLLIELGYSLTYVTNLFCDDKVAIDIFHNPIPHDSTKHVEVDRHFIKEKLDVNNSIFVCKIKRSVGGYFDNDSF